MFNLRPTLMGPHVPDPSEFNAFQQLQRQQGNSSQIAAGHVMPQPSVGANQIEAFTRASQGQQNPMGGIAGNNNSGFGWNMDTARLALGGLQTLGNIWAARKAYGLQRDIFNHQRDLSETNLMNSIQSYNTALSDRSNTRAHMEGRDQASADEYVEENRMRRYR